MHASGRGACDKTEGEPGKGTQAWQQRPAWESSHVAGSRDTGKKTELSAGCRLDTSEQDSYKGVGLVNGTGTGGFMLRRNPGYIVQSKE